jgi:hypothetical protein
MKDNKIGVETEITHVLPNMPEDRRMDMKVSGRMDYNVWYGRPREAETNLMVVEAKQKQKLGFYQVADTRLLLIWVSQVPSSR